VKAVGNPIGALRPQFDRAAARRFSGETVAALKRAYRLFFNSDLNLSQALERARTDCRPSLRWSASLAFVESSERGVPA